jgi:hypothetical protein
VVLLLASAVIPVSAEEPVTERPLMRAAPAVGVPVLDGEVLADPAYRNAVPGTGFIQNTPDEGRPASQRTEIYVVFTGDTLFFGIVCHDTDPSAIIVAGSRRDSPLDEQDSIRIILDTYRDQQTGFVFGTNPTGLEFDGQVTREGQGGRYSSGGFNKNWDGAWQVEAKISEIGWTAEFAIPFRTIRFPRGRHQTWAVNVQRNIRRRNERAFWSELPRQFTLFRLSMAGTIEAIEVPAQRNLKITPYVLGEVLEEGIEGAERETEFDWGLDLKFSLTPSMTLDATYNTDFAQVEVDEFQINLNRFNLFFPEKRPFFLENAGYFSVGVPHEVELFFSRRIGIGPEGEIIPITGGLRVTGKAAERYNVGALYMRTEEVDGVAPTNDFGVVRLSRDFPNRSYLGMIAVSREGSGSLSHEADYNRTFGLDGRWGIGEYGLVQGFVAKTETPGADEAEHAFRFGGGYDSPTWSYSANYTEVADDFNPEVGFVTRVGYRKLDGAVMRRVRPQNLGKIHELRPHMSYRGYWNFDGFQETGFLHIDNHTEWKNGSEVHTGINFTREGVTTPFEIYPGVWVPRGTYDHAEAQLVYFTNRGAPVSFSIRTYIGGFFGGDRLSTTTGFNFRIGETFNTEIQWRRNDIDLPGGAFITNLGLLRLSYSFTTNVFVQALIQYNDRDDLWATNLRFAWQQSANTGLHVVYNEIRDIHGSGTGIPDRNLIVKYSYLFDVFR